jgi:secreted trypsin-like serine protease
VYGAAAVLRPIALLLAVCACLSTAGSASADAGSRIVGGHDADIAAWPFLVALVRADRPDAFEGQFCGGSLVAPRVVVTAAHCLDGRPTDVLVGRTILSGTDGERIPVVERRLPPGYDAATNEPDLAVLVLERPASASPVPLGAGAVALGAPLEVAGWGLVEQAPEELSADGLQSATVQALAPRACRRAYGRTFAERTMLCASTPGTGMPDSCQGDSGGPLVSRAGGVAVLLGVVSFGGQRCGDPQKPGVYARVAAARAWLDGEIARATGAVAPAPAQREPVAADVGSIRIRFGRMSCPSSRCFVDLRTSGPVEALSGGLVLWVRRGGREPVDRFALAGRVRSGLWRAWVNLPYGTVRLIAVGVDLDAKAVTPRARETIRVSAG